MEQITLRADGPFHRAFSRFRAKFIVLPKTWRGPRISGLPPGSTHRTSPVSKIWLPDFPFAPKRAPFFYGWVIAFGATLGTLFSIPGQTMGFSAFTDVLIEELGLSRVMLSTAYFVGTVASGLTLPWLGRVFDARGARKMVVASALATGLILFYLSESARLSLWLARPFPANFRPAVAFLVIGIGFYLIRASAQGVLTLACRNAIGKWFDHKRGIAISLSQIAISFGFSFSPALLTAMIGRFGYDGAWVWLGLATLLVMAPLGWLLFRDNPEECGLRMDGATAKTPVRPTNPDMVIERDFSRAEALRTPAFWAFNLSFAFVAYFITAYTFHIVSIGAESGLSQEAIVAKFVPMAVCSVATNLVFGLINTRLRLKHLLVVLNLASVAGAVGLLALSSQAGMAAYIVGNGVAGGAFVSLTGIVWPRFYGRRWLGAISGMGMSSMVVASGIGPLAFGLSEQMADSYQPVLLASLWIPAALAVFSFWADNPQRT